jgi:MYXO-CTERM domain-containing protein
MTVDVSVDVTPIPPTDPVVAPDIGGDDVGGDAAPDAGTPDAGIADVSPDVGDRPDATDGVPPDAALPSRDSGRRGDDDTTNVDDIDVRGAGADGCSAAPQHPSWPLLAIGALATLRRRRAARGSSPDDRATA